MKKPTVVLSVLVALLLALTSAPGKAEALPRDWRNTIVVTQNHVTYRLRKSDSLAAVTKTNGKLVVIPKYVRHNGRRYRVLNIWSSALKGCKVVYIKANLEDGHECTRLYHIKVYVANKSMLHWLRNAGVNAEKL